MSRSYRMPWVKDPANRYMKAIYARVYRSRVHQLEKMLRIRPIIPGYWEDHQSDEIDRIVGKIPHRKDLMNQYDICDYRFYISAEPWWNGWKQEWEDQTEWHKRACRK